MDAQQGACTQTTQEMSRSPHRMRGARLEFPLGGLHAAAAPGVLSGSVAEPLTCGEQLDQPGRQDASAGLQGSLDGSVTSECSTDCGWAGEKTLSPPPVHPETSRLLQPIDLPPAAAAIAAASCPSSSVRVKHSPRDGFKAESESTSAVDESEDESAIPVPGEETARKRVRTLSPGEHELARVEASQAIAPDGSSHDASIKEGSDENGESMDKQGKPARRMSCPWSADEDAQLQRAVELLGPKRWSAIAISVPGRSGKQCRCSA